MEIKKYIEENEQRFIDELFSLIRIPSISALPQNTILSVGRAFYTTRANKATFVPKDGDSYSSKPVQTRL